MPKRTTTFAKNSRYHGYNRGFEKSYIFKNEADKERFLEKAIYYSKKFKVAIESSTIVPNHYHFLLKQNEDSHGVQKFLSRLQLSHANYYNLKYKRRGPVFEGRYNAELVTDKRYYFNMVNYISNNPLKHRAQNLFQSRDSKK